jgi:hypothetical protein
MRAAFAAAVAGQTFGAEYVRHHLRRGVSPLTVVPPALPTPPSAVRQAERLGDRQSPRQEVLPL